MKEELNVVINRSQLEGWNLSVKPIVRPNTGCMAHYDVWHLVNIKEQTFDYDSREYYDAGWFNIREAVSKIKRNLDFAKIVSLLPLA